MPSFFTNLKTSASTQFKNFDFNSFCHCFDTSLAANKTGLYELCGDDDAGEDIDLVFTTPIIDFGIQNNKQLRFVYIGYECDGQLKISTSFDSGAWREELVVPHKSGRQRQRVPICMLDNGRYIQFQVENVDGSFLAVDNLSAILTVRPEGVI